MNLRTRLLVPVVATTGFLLAGGSALAALVVSTTLTGQVTTVSGSQSVTINGQTYQIAPGSPAASTITQVQPGQRVDVKLDGAAGAPGTHVIAISPHTGP